MSNSRNVLRGLAWGLFAISIWVSWMLATRWGVRSSLSVWDLTALRFASAGLILLPFAWQRGLDPRRLGWGLWAAMVVLVVMAFFLVGKGSFERLVPERFTGEASFKFSPQLAMGELQWHYQIDNDCNLYGDFGFHKYEITRAYRPVRPANVIPVLYRRCPYDLGITACPTTGSLL
jgi:hypothetical protein